MSIGGESSKEVGKGIVGEVGAKPGKCCTTESKKIKGIGMVGC